MIAVKPLRTSNDDIREVESYLIGDSIDDFSCASSLLDDIDFDDLFVGIDYGDVLPNLEIDPEILAEFSVSGGEELSDDQLNLSSLSNPNEKNINGSRSNQEEEDRGSGLGSGSGSDSCLSREDETVSKRDDEDYESIKNDNNQTLLQNNKESISTRSRKSVISHKKISSQGKRKVKVDWTPELHRRFVQAVEQLGMDKAVPSKILEIMGINCLTRHNIASHLQKYRSHQKHLLVREAEAASWSQRRQIYGGAAISKGNNKRLDHLNPWIAPTIGFPPPTPANLMHPQYRPLHVWGHPSVDHSSTVPQLWPKHLLHHSPSSLAPPHGWSPPLPPPSNPSSSWHVPSSHHPQVQNAIRPGSTPSFPPQSVAKMRMPSSTTVVPCIPPHHHATYRVGGGGIRPRGAPSDLHHPLPLDHLLQPTKERLDSAIGDVLSKPWLPLPLGLRPPSHDSVMVELQLQGIPNIPPTTKNTSNTNTSTTTSSIA